MRRIVVSLGLAVALLTLSVAFEGTPPARAADPPDPDSVYSRYVDPDFGFSLYYPQGWSYTEDLRTGTQAVIGFVSPTLENFHIKGSE